MPTSASTNPHDSLLQLRDSARSKLARYDIFFVVERRRSFVLFAAILLLLTTICVLGTFLIQEQRAIGIAVALLAALCTGLVTSLMSRNSPSRAVSYLAHRNELRRLLRQLDMYAHLPESVDPRQLNEIARSILELLGKEEENRDPSARLPGEDRTVEGHG